MITYSCQEYPDEREEMLLSFLPTNQFFFIVHELKPGYSDSAKCLMGPFLKIAFITEFGICNALNFVKGEILRLREDETMIVRFVVNRTIVFEELKKMKV